MVWWNDGGHYGPWPMPSHPAPDIWHWFHSGTSAAPEQCPMAGRSFLPAFGRHVCIRGIKEVSWVCVLVVSS
jgi:hypothetical protein